MGGKELLTFNTVAQGDDNSKFDFCKRSHWNLNGHLTPCLYSSTSKLSRFHPNHPHFHPLPQLRVSVEKCHLREIWSCFQSWSSVQIWPQPDLLILGIQINSNQDQLAKPLQRDTVRSCSSSSRFLLQHLKTIQRLELQCLVPHFWRRNPSEHWHLLHKGNIFSLAEWVASFVFTFQRDFRGLTSMSWCWDIPSAPKRSWWSLWTSGWNLDSEGCSSNRCITQRTRDAAPKATGCTWETQAGKQLQVQWDESNCADNTGEKQLCCLGTKWKNKNLRCLLLQCGLINSGWNKPALKWVGTLKNPNLHKLLRLNIDGKIHFIWHR